MIRSIARTLLRRVMRSSAFRDELWEAGRDLFAQPRVRGGTSDARYYDLPQRYRLPAARPRAAPRRAPPIFITSRFRSGSTFLWQLFGRIEHVTSYYEPLNERRWFLSSSDTATTDPTHLGVTDYGQAYRGMDDLDALFSTAWSYRRLYMDEASQDRPLQRYIAELIARAPHRPVLQFNRVDFRLRWLRSRFPEAGLLHLYRCPRNSWMSVQHKGRVPLDATLDTFAPYDGFYLLPWQRDLRGVFPCLDLEADRHPYAVHYLIWRLSYCHGRTWADLSIAYEDLVGDLAGTMQRVAQQFALGTIDIGALAALNSGVLESRWRGYADDDWFAAIEAECEEILAAYFRTGTRAPTDAVDVPGRPTRESA